MATLSTTRRRCLSIPLQVREMLLGGLMCPRNSLSEDNIFVEGVYVTDQVPNDVSSVALSW